jgi:hypothetical protein
VVSAATVAYQLVLRCDESRAVGGRTPVITTYVERADGQVHPVLTLLDTGAAISVFDGGIATNALGFDPRANPIGVVPLAGFAAGLRRTGYVHEVHCYFGGYVEYGELMLHVAFTDPDDELAFNVLGREGLHGAPDRGFFSQVQFGYRHRPPVGPPEVYLTFRP